MSEWFFVFFKANWAKAGFKRKPAAKFKALLKIPFQCTVRTMPIACEI